MKWCILIVPPACTFNGNFYPLPIYYKDEVTLALDLIKSLQLCKSRWDNWTPTPGYPGNRPLGYVIVEGHKLFFGNFFSEGELIEPEVYTLEDWLELTGQRPEILKVI